MKIIPITMAAIAAMILQTDVLAAKDADDAAAKTEIEGTVSVSAGGAWVHGDDAAFQQRFQEPAKTLFGGIEDLRYRRESEHSSLSIDGQFLPGDGDYGLIGRWSKEEKLYVDFGYKRYRVFYDGSGAYFPGSGAFVQLYDERLHVDRGQLWFEIGFAPEDLPHFVLRYERDTRSGLKPSSELGDTNLTGGAGARSIVPSFIDVDEARDVVTFDISREKADSQVNAGLRYEHSRIDDARQNRRRPNEAASRAVTSKDDTDGDLFSAHGFYERTFGPRLRLSAGAMATTLDTNISGSRVYGDDYDPVFDPLFARRQVGDLGFLDLAGGAQLKQYVGTANVVYQPGRYWTIRPSIRYEHLHLDDLSTFIATNIANSTATTQQNDEAQTRKQEDKFTEVMEVRYTGHAHWVYNLRGEWTQTEGNLNEYEFDRGTNGTVIDRATDYTRVAQKYSLGALWYPRPGLSCSSEYYYRLRMNDYNATRDSTPAGSQDRYPAFITNQDFSTHDFNLRVSWRPLSTVSWVTRYDLQYSTVQSGFVGIVQGQSARATAHIVSESVTWTPIAQLYLVAAVNLTYDQLATPAAAFVLNSDNNYVNGSLSAGYAVGKYTDFYLDVTHYRARDLSNNSVISLPYGADQSTQTASLTTVFHRTKRTVYTVKYTYASNREALVGGRNDFRAHIVYAKVQYSF